MELEGIIDIDMETLGFECELDILDSITDVLEDDCNIEIKDNPVSKQGEVYKLGNHYLMCGDSTNINDVNKLMNGVKADMVVTDPPYNVNYTGKTKDNLKIENDNLDDEAFLLFLFDAFSCMNEVLKDGGVFYIWHADSEGYAFRKACIDIGWKVRECLIWNKNAMVLGRQDYHWKHEPCLYGWKDGESHYWGNDRKQTTVLDFDKPTKNDLHPTMKPVTLFAYQIKNSSKKEDIVLDLFAGSGTTIIACEQSNRKAYCMEYDPRYVDVIIERWEKFTNKKAELITS